MSGRPAAVVVTCFNLGRTLEEAVGSVLAQTVPAAELVVIDDGSEDVLTIQVLARLTARGVRVFRAPHRGVSAARNLGIRATTAPELVLLDADDRLHPEYLERTGAYLHAHPQLSFVSCAMESFGETVGTWRPPDPEVITSLTFGVPHISSRFTRALWSTVGGFDEEFGAQEDLDFWTSSLFMGFQGAVLDQALFQYRVRPDSNYHTALAPDAHRALMTRFYRKHLPSLEERAPELLLAKERFLIDQRAHAAALDAERAALAGELADLQREIDQAVADLRAIGRDRIEFGTLRQIFPVSPVWGTDRGLPLDRHYVHAFLDRHRQEIRGRVLEVKDSGYTHLFGDDRVTGTDVIDIDPSNRAATVIADLTAAGIRDDSYDCVILTQTLGLIYRVQSAVREVFRILRPGGTVLCTLPATGRISYEGPALDGDFWRFTEASARALFADAFPSESFDVTGFGNVLAAAAFLYGLAPQELSAAELDATDPYFPVVYGVRATKPRIRTSTPLAGLVLRPAARLTGAAILIYHRVTDSTRPGSTAVSISNFEVHLQALRGEGYQIMGLPELVDRADHGREDPPAIALTFDDGYVDALEVVAPALQAHHLPGMFFLVGGAVDGTLEFWWDLVERIFDSDRRLRRRSRSRNWASIIRCRPILWPEGRKPPRQSGRAATRCQPTCWRAHSSDCGHGAVWVSRQPASRP